MQIIRTVKEMKQKAKELKGKEIGFVPTMGFFHEGHTSLMEQAQMENEIVVVSVFVNPLQFGENEDYDTYPRDELKDIQIAEENGVNILFIPDVHEMYPNEMSITMQAHQRTMVLCGHSRPGHFDGVVTVLTKLFNLIQPSKVYFGMKDAQQVAVVDGLISDFNFPVVLIGLPTVREDSGLAKSSRNVHLTNYEKNEALWLYKALIHAKKLVVDGERNPDTIINDIHMTISEHTTGIIDYIEILSYPQMEVVDQVSEQIIIALAVTFKKVRLIDNLILNKDGKIINRL